MPRVTSSATITALASDSINLATLIKLDFPTPIYITDYGQDITYNSQNYDASSYILEVGGASETGDIRVNSMDLILSAVEQSYVSLFLNNNYVNVAVTIQRACLDDNGAVIGEPITYFDGRIVGYGIEDSGQDSTLNVEIASHWQDFDKVQNRKTNSKSQQFWFPNDRGFQYAASTITNLKWGRK
jgi:hypothetical protein